MKAIRVTPINRNSKPDWSMRKKSRSKGHTESHQLVRLHKDEIKAIHHDVIRIHMSNMGARVGLVRYGGESFHVKEVQHNGCKYWERVV